MDTLCRLTPVPAGKRLPGGEIVKKLEAGTVPQMQWRFVWHGTASKSGLPLYFEFSYQAKVLDLGCGEGTAPCLKPGQMRRDLGLQCRRKLCCILPRIAKHFPKAEVVGPRGCNVPKVSL